MFDVYSVLCLFCVPFVPLQLALTMTKPAPPRSKMIARKHSNDPAPTKLSDAKNVVSGVHKNNIGVGGFVSLLLFFVVLFVLFLLILLLFFFFSLFLFFIIFFIIFIFFFIIITITIIIIIVLFRILLRVGVDQHSS
jgi:hypothetical protein